MAGTLRVFAGLKHYSIEEEDESGSSIYNPYYHFGFGGGTVCDIMVPAFGIMYGYLIAGGLSVNIGTSFLAFTTKITLLKARESSTGEVKSMIEPETTNTHASEIIPV